jgi:hypothetical protein
MLLHSLADIDPRSILFCIFRHVDIPIPGPK